MDIWTIALGFQDAQTLLTAEEMGVFNRLGEGPASVADVACATGIPEDSADRLLVALCALHLVEKRRDGSFANGPEAAAQLVRGKPGYIGSMFDYLKNALYPVWAHFDEALREGGPQWPRAFQNGDAPNAAMYEDPKALHAFMEGMHDITYAPATEFAAQAEELSDIQTMVDVGGASGAFLIAVAERNPHLRGIVYDLPAVRPVAERFITESDVGDRLCFHAGNFWEDPLPEGCDAYSPGFILYDWDDAGCAVILDKISTTARPGARLIIGEYLLNEAKTGPLWVARANLNMLVAARGRERSAPEYADFLRGFGFGLERIHETTQGKNFMIARRC